MSTKKDIKEIKTTLQAITSGALEKSKKYDELILNLKNIKMGVKNVSLFINGNGQIGVKIDYEVPSIKLYFDDNGELIKDKKFISINSLDLISFDEMEKISAKINEAKERNKNY